MGNGTNGTSVPSPVQVSGVTNATRIDGGGDHGCVIDAGALKCWGGNFYGDLGNNDPFNEQDSPISLGLSATDVNLGIGYSTCAIVSGSVKCWGYDQYGECGDSNFSEDDTPFDVSGISGATSIALGYAHSCVIVSGGNVYCWGDDTYGELGDGNTNTQSYAPVQAKNVTGAIALALGGDGGDWDHTCALLQSTAVVCWGSNDFGQLGDGTTTPRTSPVTPIASGAVAIAAGEAHTCALMSDGSVKCWGYNNYGQLGDGTTNDSHVPITVPNF